MLFFLLACPKPEVKESPEETGFYKHSEIVPDSDSPKDSEESGGDSDTSGDTDTAPPGLSRLEVYPAGIVVGVGASWQAAAIGTEADGDRLAVAAAWSSDDPAVASVDAAGLVTATGAGATVIRAELDGVAAEAAITVRDDGRMTVTVIGAETGAGVEGYTVRLEGGAEAETGADGVAEVEGAGAGPLTVTAWRAGWGSATVVGVIGRSLVLPVYEQGRGGSDAELHGQVGFGAVEDAEWDEIVIGMAGASVQGELGAVVLDDLFSEARSVTVIGFDVEAPANLFVEGSAEDYYSAAYGGPVSAWALAGPLAVADLPLGAGAGEALSILTDDLSRFSWGRASGEAVLGATAELDLAPAAAFSDTVLVDLPPLSAGFNGTERYFLMAAEEDPADGWVFTGFGSGLAGDRAEVERVDPAEVPASVGSAVLVYNQVGGLGSGGPVCSAVAEVRDLLVVAPPLQDVAVIGAWDEAAHTASVTVDGGAGYVRLRLTDRRGRVHDMYLSGSWSGEIPAGDPDYGWERTDLELIALETTWSSFEDRAARGDLDPRLVRASTMARTVMNN